MTIKLMFYFVYFNMIAMDSNSMDLNVTYEEKLEIINGDMYIFQIIDQEYIELLNTKIIIDKIIKMIDYNLDGLSTVGENVYDDYSDCIGTIYDIRSIKYLLDTFSGIWNDPDDVYTDLNAWFVNSGIKFIERHIVNELKKTDIPKVLQRIIIEYVCILQN